MDSKRLPFYDTVSDSHSEESREEGRVISNHSGYSYQGSENYEHDDTGSLMNYSGVEDEIYSSFAVHEDWQEGYDF